MKNHLVKEEKIELQDFLELGIKVTDNLGKIHEQHLLHKDINPSNIIWNKNTDVVKIIDFGLATTLSIESPDSNTTSLEGTLSYISPEQTGEKIQEAHKRLEERRSIGKLILTTSKS
jgi:serine/threonine protein kinase